MCLLGYLIRDSFCVPSYWRIDVLPTEVNCHQYASDRTIYSHSKPSEPQSCQAEMQAALDKLYTWSSRCNLALHPKKTKVMLLSTPQMSRTHGLDGHSIHLLWKGSRASFNFPPTWYGSARKRQLEKRETDCKISSCYGTLSVLKKLKYLAPYNVRKHLAECLILSKIDYNDIVSDIIADYLVKRLQRVQLAAAKLFTWSSRCNLTLNPKTTKVWCFFQLPRCHEFMD